MFNPAHFRMGHSVEMSMGSGGGYTSSLAMYTNSLSWRFGEKLAARADISVAYSPFGSGFSGTSDMSQRPRVFLRNAQIDYRPTPNTSLHLSVRQSPYGLFYGPYGYYPRFGYR